MEVYLIIIFQAILLLPIYLWFYVVLFFKKKRKHIQIIAYFVSPGIFFFHFTVFTFLNCQTCDYILIRIKFCLFGEWYIFTVFICLYFS